MSSDVSTLQLTEYKLHSVMADIDISESLSTRFSRLMQGWMGTGEPHLHSGAVNLSPEQINRASRRLQIILDGLKTCCPFAPRDADDVLQTEHILHHLLGLPLPLVWAVFDEAEYWVRSVAHCGPLSVAANSAAMEESLCCTARIPSSVKQYRPLRRIVFTIESHDQGWRSSNDNGSWTWFEAGSYTVSERVIMRNPPASRDFETHRIQWDLALNEDGTGADAELQQWMSRFTGGEELSVFARAQYQGWSNHVRRVQLELYCACV
ncbi:uncharacterized protein C8Q71DRAFT_774892 [Rhodofomes roseus]|uniref:Uncharacterized protein n=1 Tax=Rhodofomes roseus TaxID=34475 RepID=A0ABQ8K7P0_9APHY|nr:uncharacterized protein C8Q71DRAFT_774892 [Rhodofomes roseus]KAH9833286.1 hypothetical protein C8Q71DRAFT_774892 [Rhodofomes roseus]